ncbi:Siderophore biosynthesis non-ribosomal peptide synthetase [Pseudomonas orientalis]|uniref:condensation domain-containing protein n=1 Tax=Pseudomonas orientalis TaxID=76758 RepID=UPI000F56C231|nr:condensation domain-containing protein [Pseudomonas orientalis]AZE93126.1 Siderophore biosynthesis non-ribosomal peptide synthetase [Pseudomonas orientalis]AZE98478.1 Siderophore biosynthesis non-ribosomal peptide synthetase [Pseudomonas orientalis]
MRLILGQLYDISTTLEIEKHCVGDVLVPTSRLDADALSGAVNYLLHKFPTLRASFISKNDELIMRFCDPCDLLIDRLFQVRPAARRPLELRDQLVNYIDEVRASMSLDQPPLLRYCLFDAECASEQRLVIIFNHLVCDGISSRIIWRELSRAYKSLLAGKTLEAEPCATYQFFAQELLDRHRQLAGEPSVGIPYEPGSGLLDKLTYGLACTCTVAEVVRKESRICGADLSAVRAHAAEAGVGLSDFLLACWVQSLAKVQSTGDVTLLMWVSPHFVGDWATPVTDLVGSVSFPLPVTFSLDRRRSFIKTLQSVDEELQRGLSNAEDFAVRYFAGEKQLAPTVLPGIGFNFVSDQRPGASLIGYELAPEDIHIERLSQEPFELALGLDIELYGQQMHVSLSATPRVAAQLPMDQLIEDLLTLFEKTACET